MKINDSQRIGAYRMYQNTSEHRTEHTTGKKRKDEVQISAEAKELLGAQGAAEDPSRARRIENLKNAVSTGTYYVDSSKLAESLLPFFKPTSKPND